MTIVVHMYRESPYNHKVLRMLNLKGIPYTEKYWPISARKAISAFSPSGKLPALEHDGKTICDSTDIAWYLEEQFPTPALIPEDKKLRGLLHTLEDWADESLYFYEMRWRFTFDDSRDATLAKLLVLEKPFLRWFFTKVIPGSLKKTLDGQGVGRKDLAQLRTDTRRHIEAVDNLLSAGPWLLGESISVADLAVYGMLQCFRDAPKAAEELARCPAVEDWMARVEQASDEAAA